MTEESVKNELHQLHDEFWTKGRAKDYAGMADIYHDDATIMTPGRESFGKKDAAVMLERYMAMGIADGVVEPEEVLVAGDIAVERGRLKFLGAAGQVMEDGKFVKVWKRMGSTWKCYIEIMNSNKLPPKNAPAP